jgi:hypothetical protein
MFDWDKDVGELYESRRVGYEPQLVAEPEPRDSFLRIVVMRWFAPAAIVAGMFSAGISLFDPGLESARVARASMSNLGAMIFGVEIGEPPAELVAYGPEQFRNFMRAMADFSDTDLLDYAAATARDLGDHADPATPFMLDVLFLTHQEIERRGLRRPTASLRIDAIRDTYRGAQAAL